MKFRTLTRLQRLTDINAESLRFERWLSDYLIGLGVVDISLTGSDAISDNPNVGSGTTGDTSSSSQFHIVLRIIVIGFCVIVTLAGVLFGLKALIGLCFLCIAAGFGATRFISRRRRSRISNSWPAALDHIARSIRSGVTLSESLRTIKEGVAKELTDSFGSVLCATRSGLSLPDAIERLAKRLIDPASQTALAALHICACDSAIGAQPIDGAAKTLRDSAEIDREVQALISQSSLSMFVLTVLPFAGLALGATGSGRGTQFLFHDPQGRILMIAAVLLDIAGWLWMRYIIKGVMQ